MKPQNQSQFALLAQQRFGPFFGVQFLGAANDNVFKFAFTMLVTYRVQVEWLPGHLAGLLIGAIFIAPFLLFSATSGQLADKYDKARLTQLVKSLEVLIMLLATAGLFLTHVPLLLACIFLLGLHSTLFGPIKFAYLPQHLSERELTGGNGMIEMGTFVAILLGNVVGGVLIALPEGVWLTGAKAVALTCLGLAVLGRLLAHWVPGTPATAPNLQINWNPLSETWRNLRLARENVVVFRSLLGISWMWFFGAVFLSQFPSYTKDVLHGNEHVASLLLVVFSMGIALGSLACESLSRQHVEIGLVPLGALGMSVFGLLLWSASRSLPASPLQTLPQFMADFTHWPVLVNLFMLAFSAGLYSVPMYALVQLRSPATHRARIIAANNILNALFMIASSLLVALLLGLGWSIPSVFAAVALSNFLVAGYIFLLVPEYLLRFVAWLASRCVYRLRIYGEEHIPVHGPALLISNHVSFVDAVLLMAVSPRPIYFLMDHRIFQLPVLGALFRLAKAVPIAPRSEDPEVYAQSFAQAHRVLARGDLLAIFPEGGITRDGQLQPFKPGVLKLLQQAHQSGVAVPVIPVGLNNLWGSFFSRIETRKGEPVAMVKPFRRGVFSRVVIRVGEAFSVPQDASTGASPEGTQAQLRILERELRAQVRFPGAADAGH